MPFRNLFVPFRVSLKANWVGVGKLKWNGGEIFLMTKQIFDFDIQKRKRRHLGEHKKRFDVNGKEFGLLKGINNS